MTNSETSQGEITQISQLDYTYPLFLQPSDSPGTALISLKLTGPKNYTLWSRSLLGKNKLGLVDESCIRSMYKGELAKQWDRCNALVLSSISGVVAPELVSSIVLASTTKKVWNEFKERFRKSNLTRIYQLWRDIAMLTQSIDSITVYYSKLKDCWDELDLLAPHPPICGCVETSEYVSHLNNQRLLQFLMGLNETYNHVRSDILLRDPVLSVNQAYSIIIQEESQRKLGTINLSHDLVSLLAASRDNNFRAKKPINGGTMGIIPRTICEYCGYKGHLKKNCYRLVGYPPDFRSKRQLGTQGSRDLGLSSGKKNYPQAHHAHLEKGESSLGGSGGHYLADEEYQNYLNWKDKGKGQQSQEQANDHQCNFAGALQWQGTRDW